MENPNNIWFQTNKTRIEKLKRSLLEYSYSGSYGGAIDLMGVIQIIDGALVEIVKLTREINEKENQIKSLTKENEK